MIIKFVSCERPYNDTRAEFYLQREYLRDRICPVEGSGGKNEMSFLLFLVKNDKVRLV